MTARELLNAGIAYVAERSMDAWECRDNNVEYFLEQQEKVSAMSDLLDYLKECLEEEAE